MTAPRPSHRAVTRLTRPMLALACLAALAACGRSGATPPRGPHAAGGAAGDPYGTCTTEAAAGEPGCDDPESSTSEASR
jgi:hypothetical protein